MRGRRIADRTDNQTLVGRDGEITIIDAALDALASGDGSVAFFAGEPGIGKSTLARYAASAAAERDIPTYWGFGWEAGGAPAYWPWTQALRSLVKEQCISRDGLCGLSKLLPESVSEEPTGLNPDQMRFQLLEAMRSLLESVNEVTPVVLILEDLHAADADSLLLLQYLARHAPSMAVCIVGTYRIIEARAMPEADTLTRASRDAVVLELQPFNERDVREFLDAGESDERVQQLLQTTGGNPLFLAELVQAIEAGAKVSRLPATVQQVIDQQIRLLPETAASVLAHASIQGRTFSVEELAGYTTRSTADILDELQHAITAGLVRPFGSSEYRFSHALHRDVVYNAMPGNERSLLHLTYAERIRADVEQGNDDRWSEIAVHLEAAGSEHRRDAIEAWRHAASRAQGRLAYDEAAQQYAHALETFGSGPRFSPGERFDLLLECANANILAGHVEKGQQHCRDAYAIARTLEDAERMSEAALTWGSVFVVARIDKELIAALRECVDWQEQLSVATRAKLLARLAAALQPAEDPAEPIVMAREAIDLARSTGDDNALHHVLRSAISAMMDFVAARDRIPLNREFTELAARLGDVPGRFRSNLRLMTDAAEVGDGDMLRDAIDTIDNLARRIGLPHYLWRAASASAMLATIEGRFDDASRLLDEAEAHASQIVDAEAELVLPLQRFALLTEWQQEQPNTIDVISERLNNVFSSQTPEAEFFVTPFVRSHTAGLDAAVARKLTRDSNMIRRVFAYRDRFSLCATGSIALLAGDLDLAERVLDECEEFKGDCAGLGLLGNVWLGPVATTLGDICMALGRTDDAEKHYQRAFELCEGMRAQPCIARLHAALATLEMSRGNDKAATEHRERALRIREQLQLREFRVAPATSLPTEASVSTELSLMKNGDTWDVDFGGTRVPVRDSKGLQMLSVLVNEPGKEFHVLDLSGASQSTASGDSGPVLDDTARAQYQRRISELKDELEEATDFADVARADALREELDALTQELAGAFGLGGRARKSGSDAERARVNVRRRIKDAIDRISEQHPGAGRFLNNTIKTGTYCKYEPM